MFYQCFSKFQDSNGLCESHLSMSDVVRGKKIELNSSACQKSSQKITLQLVVSGLVCGVASPVTAIVMVPEDRFAVGKFVATGMLLIAAIFHNYLFNSSRARISGHKLKSYQPCLKLSVTMQ